MVVPVALSDKHIFFGWFLGCEPEKVAVPPLPDRNLPFREWKIQLYTP